MKPLLLTVCLLAPALALAQSTRPQPSREVSDLIRREEAANDRCRGGSGDNPATHRACSQRDGLVEQLEKLGWCYGHEGQVMADRKWEPCQQANAPAPAPAQSDCRQTIEAHGFLSRAQFQCGFRSYSREMLDMARVCGRTLGDETSQQLLRSGMEMYDFNEGKVGRQAMCRDVLQRFPGVVRR